MSEKKFMSRRTASGLKVAIVLISSFGEGSVSTSEKWSGRNSFSADLIP